MSLMLSCIASFYHTLCCMDVSSGVCYIVSVGYKYGSQCNIGYKNNNENKNDGISTYQSENDSLPENEN